MKSSIKYFLFALALCLSPALAPLLSAADALLEIAPQKTSGIYAPGEKIIWDLKIENNSKATVTQASYVILQGGEKKIAGGDIDFKDGLATVETTASSAGTLLLEVTIPAIGDKKPFKAHGGAAIDPDKIQVSAPIPDDFDAFWKGKIEELSAIPMNPSLEKVESGKPEIDYWKITLDNVKGTKVRGQIARPAKGDKFPAMLILQYAGVYPLQKPWVINPASQGWLVLNIIAHDLPIDEPKEYYDKLLGGDLKDYTAIGNEDRETSYFLRMLLSCYRAADYLAQRPDWNGEVFLVTGGSQGGFQSLFTAAFFPKVTAMVIDVPAGCDPTALMAGRRFGWPYWYNFTKGRDEKKVMETSRYYDGVNFATYIKCNSLVSLGLIDTTSRPEGVLAAFNQIKGPKEAVIMPLATHKEKHEPYNARRNNWFNALVKGQPAPVPSGN